MKHPNDKRIGSKLILYEICWKIIGKVAMTNPLEKVVTDQLEGWIDKEGETIKKCSEDMDQDTKISSTTALKLVPNLENKAQEQQL